MKYVYYIAFVSIVIVIGWIFRPVDTLFPYTTLFRDRKSVV